LIEDKYLDVDFTNVKLRSSKMLRHYLKLGIPEARGILNITVRIGVFCVGNIENFVRVLIRCKDLLSGFWPESLKRYH